MLICLACRRQDGDHSLNCSYISRPDEDRFIREFMDDNAELFESERLTHLLFGEIDKHDALRSLLSSLPSQASACITIAPNLAAAAL